MDLREARLEDIPSLFAIRVAVRENTLTEAQLHEQGITPVFVAQALQTDSHGWIIEEDQQVVGFSIANARTHSIWALFVLPEYEGRGVGRRLLEVAVQWLWAQGAERIWLTTEPQTRAAGFYHHFGWHLVEVTPEGDLRLELVHPASSGV